MRGEAARRLPAVLPGVAVAGGAAGSTAFVIGSDLAPDLAAAALAFLVGLPVVGLAFATAVMAAGEDDPHPRESLLARCRRRFASGSLRVWPAALLLAGLPVQNVLPAAAGGRLAALHALVAALLLAWRWPPSGGEDADAAPESGRVGPWQWALLALVGAISVLYLVIGHAAEGSRLFDGNYYFGVARHIASTGRFEEPIVWHFLSPPDSIVHPPFDYWSGMTVFLLVPVLWLFGSTYHVALVAMTLVSVLGLVGFWYLVTVAAPLRHPLTQLTVVLLFAFSPAVDGFRFDTETVPVSHLFLVLALIAFARRRHALAVALGFCVGLTRLDGMLYCFLILCGVVIRILRGPRDDRAAALRRTGIVLGVLAALFLSYHLYFFGTPTPPAGRQAAHLESESDMLVYGVERDTSLGHLLRVLEPERLGSGLGVAFKTLRTEDFLPAQELWLILALVGCLVDRRATPLLALALLFTPFVTVPLLPTRLLPDGTRAVFNARQILPLLPVVVFAGGVALDVLYCRLSRWRRRGGAVPARSLGVAFVLFSLCYLFLADLRPYGERQGATTSFAHLEQALGGEPVMTCIPYNVVAYTRSPAVAIPVNGEAAIDAVLRRYDVPWLLLPPMPVPRPLYRDRPSDRLLIEVYGGRRDRIGSFRLVFAGNLRPGLRLFRVVPPADRMR